MSKCKNCGKDMLSIEDFANKDVSSSYCTFCLKDDGSLRTAQEFKDVMTIHLLSEEGKNLTKQLGMEPAENKEDAVKIAEWVMEIMKKNIPEMKNMK